MTALLAALLAAEVGGVQLFADANAAYLSGDVSRAVAAYEAVVSEGVASTQLETNLGLKVDLQPSPFAELLKNEKADNASGLFRAAWSADYPSGENFLFPLLSKKSLPPGDNRGRYNNPAFDDLLVRARTTTDDAQRISLIKQAEKIAIGDDMALIPLWYRSQNRVYDATKWQNVVIDFFENPTLDTISLK